MREKLKQVIEQVSKVADRLAAFKKPGNWRVADDRVSVHDINAYPAWQPGKLPYAWPARDGAKTFHFCVEPPAHYEGLALSGSAIQLEIWFIIGAQVYVNGELVYEVDYWADTQVVPLVLTEHWTPGETFDVVIQCRQGDGFGRIETVDVTTSALEEWHFKLDTFANELAFVVDLTAAGDVQEERLEAACAALDWKGFDAAFDRLDWTQMEAQMEVLRAALAEACGTAPKAYSVHLIGHAHIDMNWLWPWEETIELIRRDFESVLGILEEQPDVRFSHSQAATYATLQELYPQLYARVRRAIEAGQWEVTAATWVEGDLNMSGHESMARQFLLGTRYATEQLGVRPQVCWEPDTFGHPASMPHILQQAGIRYYYHMRATKGNPLYWWQGTGGARVLVFNDPRGYNGRITASLAVPGSMEMARRYGLRTNMYVYGVGDHGGGITRIDVERARRLDRSPLLPRFVFSHAEAFFREVEAAGCKLPVHEGEMNTVFEGCYTSHGDIKAVNRALEHGLTEAETYGVMAALLAPEQAQREVELQTVQAGLAAQWRRQCFNQFHDILCGCSIHITYDEAVPAAQEALRAAEQLGGAARKRMVQDMHLRQQTEENDVIVTVFNSLSWQRDDVVTLELDAHPLLQEAVTGDVLVDGRGEETALQRSGNQLFFIARAVPALGWRSYALRRGASSASNSFALADSHTPTDSPALTNRDGVAASPVQQVPLLSAEGNPILDNGRYSIEIDAASGTIVGWHDRRYDKEWTLKSQGDWIEANQQKGRMNLFEVLYEEPHPMSAWKLGSASRIDCLIRQAQVTAGACGPVYSSVTVRHKIGASEIRQEIRCYHGLSKVDFITRVSWGEVGTGTKDAPMLRVSFTPRLQEAQASGEIPFGALRRLANGQEFPAIHWIDTREKESENGSRFGFTIANTGKYGHACEGNTMRLSLIRSSYEPDNVPDVGEHAFVYSALPYASASEASEPERHGWALNRQLRAESVVGSLSACGEGSLLSIAAAEKPEATGVIVTALKPAEDAPHAIVLRLMGTQEARGKLRLRLPFDQAHVEQVDLIERPQRRWPEVANGQLEVKQLEPGEILTLKLTPR